MLLENMKKITYYAERVFTTIAIFSIAVIVVSVTMGIIARYVFGSPFLWTEELSVLMLVWLSFTSIATATVKKRHIVADFLVQNMRQQQKEMISMIGYGLSIVFLFFVMVSAIKMLPTLTFKTAALKISRKLYYYPLILVLPLMVMVYITEIIESFSIYRNSKKSKTRSLRG